MRIKRYFAPDIKQAIRMVREEQGPDAVILSNRKVDGGVEIVAARDFDEQMLMDKNNNPQQAAQNRAGSESREQEKGYSAVETRRRTDETFQEAMQTYGRPSARREAPGEKPEMTPAQTPARRPPAPSVRASQQVASTPWRERPEDDWQTGGYNPADNAGHFRSNPLTERSRDNRQARGNPSSGFDDFSPQRPRPETPGNQSYYEDAPEENTQRRGDGKLPPRRNEQEEDRFPASAPPRRPQAGAEPRFHPVQEDHQGSLMRSMQQELRQMRRMLDSHLGETGWQNTAQRSPLRLDLLRHFSDLGFSRRMTLALTNRLEDAEDMEQAMAGAQQLLASELLMAQEDLIECGGIIALVGPTGVGKTTTIAKLAAKFRLRHGPREIALITTDNYRIAACEQLTTYGRILDVPVRVASGLDELHQHLDTFYDRRLVLIDTAGMGQRDMRLLEQIGLFNRVSIPLKSYLVLSAASQLRTMQEAIEAFQGFSPEACILTKLDEAAQLGPAVSAVIDNRLPISFICDGQQVPEDLHPARKYLLLNRCLERSNHPDDDTSRPLSYEDWIVHANV